MVEPVLKKEWNVVAYNESWGGYGDNQSRTFNNEKDAIEYARTRPEHLKPVKIWKTITMDPINIPVKF